MTTPAVLARLNPKNVRFDVGSGGKPSLTMEDVAGACAGLSPLAYRLALVKYTGDERQVSRLKTETLLAAADLSISGGWGIPKKGQLSGLCNYAIWRVVGTHHCPKCNGAGVYKDNYRRTLDCFVCKKAGGISAAALSDFGREIAGFTAEEWRNIWKERAERLAGLLADADHNVSRQLNYQLTEVDG